MTGLRLYKIQGDDMKVLLTWQATPEEVSVIRGHIPDDVQLVMTPGHPYMGRLECYPNDMMELGQDADVIMGWANISTKVLESAKELKFIAWLNTGCDNLDLAALQARGIKVSNVRGVYGVVVAEQAFGFVLALAKRLLRNHKAVVEGEFTPPWQPDFASIQLAGGTMVIVGMGSIGEEVAKRAKAFAMKVIGVDPSLRSENADAVVPPEELLQVLCQADFVVLSVPLTEKTRRMISEEELRAMPSTAYLINVSRGEIVHEGPLARALSEGWIAGFASDVWWDYPQSMPPSYHFALPSRLGVHRMPNVVASGDRASNVIAVKNRVIEMGAESAAAFFKGEVPPRLADLELGY